ncbi:uncharacterized protein LOC119720097 [Patiria miniata]|uniref:Uncharacterized protein n=1 Tax=Patiria miniata TaxID=46514 RepID=A0A913Z157_PATMI|nr:uncharacterized protein LOC119720097 [Patiria miniata]
MDMPSVRLQCDFSNFEYSKAIECGVNPSYPRELNTVQLNRCTKNIRSHLQKWKVAAYDVNVEWKLILLRCGLFDVDAYTDKTICPAHRYKLGFSWTSSRKCCHPLHKGKGKPFRGVNKATSREMFDRWGTLVTVGTGICRGCLSKHKQAVTHQTAEQLPPSDVLSKEQVEQQCTTSDFTSPAGVPSLQPTDTECTSVHEQTSESSSTNGDITQDVGALDSSWAPTPRPKNVKLQSLNTFLTQGGMSAVDGQLHLSLDKASDSTIRYYRRKAKEAFGLVLHCLAPGQEDGLMKITIGETTAESSQSGQDFDSSTRSLVECYQTADNWCTKRQILSILARNMTKQRLLQLIPGLTIYRIDAARKHAKESGGGQPVELEPITRSRLQKTKVDHFIQFISRPEFVQDVAFGTRRLKLTQGEKIEIPNVVRTVVVSRLVDLYQVYCHETGFTPLGRSSLFSITQVCAAAKKKSLSGLDNIAAEASEGFDAMDRLIGLLGEFGEFSTALNQQLHFHWLFKFVGR